MAPDGHQASVVQPAPNVDHQTPTLWNLGNGLWQQLHIRTTRLLLGTSLSLLFLWLALRGIPYPEVLNAFARADYHFVVLAVLLVLLSPLVRAIRWKLLYHPNHTGLSIPRLAIILLVGQMLNIVIPARAGEIARIHFMGQGQNTSRSMTLGTIVIEKWLDILMVLLLLLFLPAFFALPSWFQDTRNTLTAFVVVFFGTALLLSAGKLHIIRFVDQWLTAILPPNWRDRIHHSMSLALNSLDVLRSPRVGLQLQLLSCTAWSLSILVNYLTFRALSIDLTLAGALFLLAVLQVGIAVPSSPGKLGIFHYLCVLALGFLGVNRSDALAYSFLLYAIVFLPPVILGAAGLWWEIGQQKVGSRRDKIAHQRAVMASSEDEGAMA